MNRINLLAMLALTLTGLNMPAIAEPPSVKFAIGEWSPYSGMNIPNYGMAAEIVTAACATVGLTPEYQFFPWRRAEAFVASGEFFGTFPYLETPERVEKFYFSDGLFTSIFGILTHKSNKSVNGFSYTEIKDLKNYRVGIVDGTDAIRSPLTAIGVKVFEAPAAHYNIKKLMFNRVDIVIDDISVLEQALQSMFSNQPERISEFTFQQKNFGEKNTFRIMASPAYPNSKDIMIKINEGISNIRKSGEYHRILASYGFTG